MPAPLRGHFDASRIGGLGYSFGAVTMGRVLRDDARVKSGFIMAVPIDTPIISGAKPTTPIRRTSSPSTLCGARKIGR